MTRLEQHYYRKGRIVNSRQFAFLLLAMNIGFWILYFFNWIDVGMIEIGSWIFISVIVVFTLVINQKYINSICEVEHMIEIDQHVRKYMNEEV